MRISGPVGASLLQVSGGTPNTNYYFHTQDTSGGRTTVASFSTDESGNAMVQAPANWGTVGYKGRVQGVGSTDIISLSNQWGSDDEFVMTTPEQPQETTPNSPVEPVSLNGG